METNVLGLIEVVVFFGGALAFCLYQLHSLKKLRREDDAKRAAGIDPNAPEDGKKKPEDIFWDTVTRVPPGKG